MEKSRRVSRVLLLGKALLTIGKVVLFKSVIRRDSEMETKGNAVKKIESSFLGTMFICSSFMMAAM